MYLLLALPIAFLALILSSFSSAKVKVYLPYLFFFVGPLLTFFGLISVLTGFNANESNVIYFGITFYTLFIAYQLSSNSSGIILNPLRFVASVINPLYLFTGPIPHQIINNVNTFNVLRFKKRLAVINADLILGIFFSAILAPIFASFFYL